MTSKLNRKMGCGWQEHDHVHHHHQCFILMTMNMFMVNIIILPWPWTERARGNKSRQGWGKEETATMGGGGSRCSSFKLAFFIYIRGSGARNFKFCLFFYIRVNLFHFCLKDGGEKSTRYFLSIPQEVLRDEGLLSKYAGKPKQQEVQSFIYEGEATKNPLTWSWMKNSPSALLGVVCIQKKKNFCGVLLSWWLSTESYWM